MEVIFDILSQYPWLIIILLGIFSSVFKKDPEEQKRKQQKQRQQGQEKKQTMQKRQEDYEDYRRQSSPANTPYEQAPPKREEKPKFDWDIDIFGESKLEELEEKLREKVNPYLEKLEKKKEPVQTVIKPALNEIKELPINAQEIAKDSPILNQDLKLSEGKVVNTSLKLNQKRVVEGVMWSEILGQPRARNPHRPVYTQFSPKRR
ncbi:hypothetical protein FIU87_14645 [Bacillus sp. THAF10]|uniref:hypothetical protein n=1 Tax=Bacillus sp. THAF10 TaxID=2587848 RepID=UPI0012683E95|nr:hypothetical protein [Bacillus sp. THAF10]QFT89900.1 hypothetical protein FIU87_14645 [Bacillus sp. THAF10]